MRSKIKVKKDVDFTKSLGLNELILLKLETKTQSLLSEELDLSKIIESIWNDNAYSDKEIIWIIFNLGMARARKDASDNVMASLKNIDMNKLLGGMR